HALLEVGDAVLDRHVVPERGRAVVVERDLVARVALYGEGTEVGERIRQVARALAVEQKGLERPGGLGAGGADARRRRRLDRRGEDRLVRGRDEERVLERDAEVVGAARLRLVGAARAHVEPGGVEREAQAIGELFFEAEAERKGPAVARRVPLGPGDDVLGDERLDERALTDHAVGVRRRRKERGDQPAHGAHGDSHEHLPATARAVASFGNSDGRGSAQARDALGGSVGGAMAGAAGAGLSAATTGSAVNAGTDATGTASATRIP